MIRAVRPLKDVDFFVKELIRESVIVHPDSDFYSYVNIQTGEKTYLDDEAAVRNELIAESFGVCERSNIDIYEFMMDISIRETGLEQLMAS
jgi:hypothetical protein